MPALRATLSQTPQRSPTPHPRGGALRDRRLDDAQHQTGASTLHRSPCGRRQPNRADVHDPSRGSVAEVAGSRGDVSGGRALQSGSPRRTAASMSETSRPRTRGAGQHLVEHAAERPDVGAPVDRFAARLLGAHVGGRAEDHAGRSPAGHVMVGDIRQASRRPARFAFERFRQAEVEHLHGAVGTTLMLAGFKSRWMMPCSCAASRRLRDLAGDRQRLVERNRALVRCGRPASALRPAP